MYKQIAAALIVGIMTQGDIDNLVELGNKAETARIEQFWKDLKCARIIKQDASVLVCIKDVEIFTLEGPLEKWVQ